VTLIDTHAHLMEEAFAHDLPEVLERARAAGVEAMVCVGYDLASSQAAVELAERYPMIWASVGIHPNSVADAIDGAFTAVAELARAPRVVGVGETGLDYFRDRAPPERQRAALAWHLALAEERRLPVVVHNREADVDIAPALEASASHRASAEVPGVLHCFSSSDSGYLDRLLRAGYSVSFAGPLTYKTNAALRAQAVRVPLDRLVVETDCPYLAPQRHRGRRNEPAYVTETAACLADIHGLDVSALAQHLAEATGRLFPALVGAAAPDGAALV
jgi:TatD DNase family protein